MVGDLQQSKKTQNPKKLCRVVAGAIVQPVAVFLGSGALHGLGVLTKMSI